MESNTPTDLPETLTERAADPARMFLTFHLHGEIFAIEVARVHEIIDPLPMTPVPNADSFAPGLINVRGAVVPVVDLRKRLGMPSTDRTADTRFVVLEVVIDEELTKIALIADRVDQVLELRSAMIEPVPELGIRWPAEYIADVAKVDGELLILLEIQTLFRPLSRAHAA